MPVPSTHSHLLSVYYMLGLFWVLGDSSPHKVIALLECPFQTDRQMGTRYNVL